MNRSVFAIRNILDKLRKAAGNREILMFYWEHYFLSRFETVDAEAYIVSYPKCGRTWLRVMLHKYLEITGIPQQYFYDQSCIGITGHPIIKFEHDQGNWVPAPLRIEQLKFKTDKYRHKKILFLVRDPRDVLVSSWYHLKYRERIYQGDLSAFIRDDLVGIRKVIAFMNMWLEHQHIPASFLLLTYEQLHSDPASTFARMLRLIGFEMDDNALQRAVEKSSFSQMKKMEMEGTLREPWMKPGKRDLHTSMKVRRGQVGGFRQELSPQDIAFLDEIICQTLSPELEVYH